MAINNTQRDRYDDRGTGRTTDQMKAMAPDAVFIWCNDVLSYPRALAEHLGRDPKRIYSPDAIDRGNLRGLRCEIVIDHAAHLTERQRRELQALRHGRP